MKRKTDIDYFSHDISFHTGNRARFLINKLGPEGYGRYWLLAEAIADLPGGLFNPDNEVDEIALAETCRTSVENFRQFVTLLKDQAHLIDEVNGMLTFDFIQQNIRKTEETREQRRNAGRKKQDEPAPDDNHQLNEKEASDNPKLNGNPTEAERESNGNLTENQRELNENLTRAERELNGKKTVAPQSIKYKDKSIKNKDNNNSLTANITITEVEEGKGSQAGCSGKDLYYSRIDKEFADLMIDGNLLDDWRTQFPNLDIHSELDSLRVDAKSKTSKFWITNFKTWVYSILKKKQMEIFQKEMEEKYKDQSKEDDSRNWHEEWAEGLSDEDRMRMMYDWMNRRWEPGEPWPIKKKASA